MEHISLQWLPTHLQVADPLTKTMEKAILVSFFNSRAFQSVAMKVYASGNRHRKCLNVVLPRNNSQVLPTKSNASDSRFRLFL